MNELFRSKLAQDANPPDRNALIPMPPVEAPRPARKRTARRPRKVAGAMGFLFDDSSRALTVPEPDGEHRALTLIPPEELPRPRSFRPGVFGVLDIGTSKVTCLIGRGEPDGTLRVMGYGMQQSFGVRLGGITDFKEAERVIRAAVGQAEQKADYHLRSVTVSLTCGAPESRVVPVRWPVGGRMVGDPDIRRIVSEGRGRALTDGRDVIHAMPLNFAVDEVQGVEDPRGHHCDQLSARLLVIDAASMALRNLTSVIGRCDLGITEMVSSPFASGLSVLVDDERELGTTVIDMGGGTTQISVFAENQLVHTGQLPVGGLHVTTDIAKGLSTPLRYAEMLKTRFGNVELTAEDDREMIGVQQIGAEDDRPIRIPRSRLIKMIRPRLEETLEMARDQLRAAGHDGMSAGSHGARPGGRIVLTGGASQLDGVQRLAAQILNQRVRLGRPTNLRGLPKDSLGPGFATAAGLLAWAAGSGRHLDDLDLNEPRPGGLLRRLVEFLRDRI